MNADDVDEFRKIERERKVLAVAMVIVVLILIVGTVALIAAGEPAGSRW